LRVWHHFAQQREATVYSTAFAFEERIQEANAVPVNEKRIILAPEGCAGDTRGKELTTSEKSKHSEFIGAGTRGDRSE
jgi:hypothetical protein